MYTRHIFLFPGALVANALFDADNIPQPWRGVGSAP